MQEPTTEAQPDLITTMQVCEALDIDRATLVRWVDRGVAITAMKLPGKNGAYLFAESEVHRLRELRGDRKQMPRDVLGATA